MYGTHTSTQLPAAFCVNIICYFQVVQYLAGCGLQSCSLLVGKGYADIGWNPVEGERYLNFLRFTVFCNGRYTSSCKRIGEKCVLVFCGQCSKCAKILTDSADLVMLFNLIYIFKYCIVKHMYIFCISIHFGFIFHKGIIVTQLKRDS